MPFTVPLMHAATLFLAGSLSFSVCLLIVSDYKHTQFSNHLAGYVRVGSFPNPSRKIGHDSWMLDFGFHSLHIDLLLYSVCIYVRVHIQTTANIPYETFNYTHETLYSEPITLVTGHISYHRFLLFNEDEG